MLVSIMHAHAVVEKSFYYYAKKNVRVCWKHAWIQSVYRFELCIFTYYKLKFHISNAYVRFGAVLIETRIIIYGSIFFASCSIWVPSQCIYIGYNSTWCEIVIEITFHHRNCFEEKDVVQMFWITRRIFHQQFNCKKKSSLFKAHRHMLPGTSGARICQSHTQTTQQPIEHYGNWIVLFVLFFPNSAF